MALLILDNQTLTLPDDITADDHLIRQALSPFYPALANAEIKRQPQADGTETISVVKQAGPKGMGHILHALQAAPRSVNPALAFYLELKRRGHWTRPLPAEELLVQQTQIAQAITKGETELKEVETLRQKLLTLTAVPADQVPVGF